LRVLFKKTITIDLKIAFKAKENITYILIQGHDISEKYTNYVFLLNTLGVLFYVYILNSNIISHHLLRTTLNGTFGSFFQLKGKDL